MIGYVAFDNPKQVAGGYTSINGGTPERISGIGELDSGVAWITNVRHFDYRAQRLYQTPHIKRNDFINCIPEELTRDIGLEDISSTKTVQIISGIYSKAIDILESDFSIAALDCKYQYSEDLSHQLIPQQLKTWGSHGTRLKMAAAGSFQSLQACGPGRHPGKAYKLFTYSFPRGMYSSRMLKQRLPLSGDARELAIKTGVRLVGIDKSGAQINGSQEWINSILEQEKQGVGFVFEAKVVYVSPAYSKVAHFGAGATSPRTHIALPELLSMIRYAKIQIIGGYAVSLTSYSQTTRNNPSYSGGLAAFIEWVALSRSINSVPTIFGSYVRAIDRAFCTEAAKHFIDAGLSFAGAGSGIVRLYLLSDEVQLANTIAMSVGMLPHHN